ncbi:MADS-box domain-containing protein [Heracleum sosnowskyi]|uniref:MADS-box domain-containing protein n=1 Tax=Heracleum sosnowskyi TaxID=360622 RepID=A0AAD8I1X6_9APIA|nr:MADS-box domain-containing protein [Heracleum sosnowskyi]
MNTMNKKTGGRKKIDMKRIEDTERRRVTFSKRRGGVFNKAGELCASTGAEILVLAQSIGGRVHAFAHPSVDSVVDTYLGNNVSTNSSACMYEEYERKYSEILEALEVEKKKSNNVAEESGGFWWENSFDDLEVDELEIFIKALEELKNKVANKADELRNSATSSLFDTIDNVNTADGLLDYHVTVPDLDEFLPNNAGIANEDFIIPAVNHDCSDGFNDFSFGNIEELVLDNHDNNHDFGSFGDLDFGQGQI